MLKLWLKHKLAELALNNMFNGLIQSFQIPDQIYKKGDKFHLIRVVSKRPSKAVRYTGLANATIIDNHQGLLHIKFEDVFYDFYISPNGDHHDAIRLRGNIVRFVPVDEIIFAGNLT